MPRPNKNSTENQARLGLKSHSKVIVVRFSPINLHRGIDGLIKSTPQQLDLVVRGTPLTVMLISDAAKTTEISFFTPGREKPHPYGAEIPLPKAFSSCTSVDPTAPYQCQGLDLEVCYYLLTAIPEKHFCDCISSFMPITTLPMGSSVMPSTPISPFADWPSARQNSKQ
ncbi:MULTISPECIES: hypothetical protein [Prochlorococcus]|uniref:hypothetical protein n=1 Tax=Prochlorococcus TaxID=1218 RepID=UPI0007BBD12B|nr:MULTISPECIES: hypothetical protein [Prochlorococcus]KZR66479.1 hypothetical protein PMIT1312_00944 [Prochlorococcus marinus str. MIT 1312]NMO83135.1 hypothetical protein [Prochlorococcus sp. P1344]NMP06136.1 hypothetical protein [Prochlorococcus sp. P1361]NMP12324.1 hypothetical protein [Prochlorococcus sp.P1363]